MTRVDPPSPVHTRPYGPGRRVNPGPDLALKVNGPVTADQAAALRRFLARHPTVVLDTPLHTTDQEATP